MATGSALWDKVTGAVSGVVNPPASPENRTTVPLGTNAPTGYTTGPYDPYAKPPAMGGGSGIGYSLPPQGWSDSQASDLGMWTPGNPNGYAGYNPGMGAGQLAQSMGGNVAFGGGSAIMPVGGQPGQMAQGPNQPGMDDLAAIRQALVGSGGF